MMENAFAPNVAEKRAYDRRVCHSGESLSLINATELFKQLPKPDYSPLLDLSFWMK